MIPADANPLSKKKARAARLLTHRRTKKKQERNRPKQLGKRNGLFRHKGWERQARTVS